MESDHSRWNGVYGDSKEEERESGGGGERGGRERTEQREGEEGGGGGGGKGEERGEGGQRERGGREMINKRAQNQRVMWGRDCISRETVLQPEVVVSINDISPVVGTWYLPYP